jgi:elongation of very long chain fatty acids protein 7
MTIDFVSLKNTTSLTYRLSYYVNHVWSNEGDVRVAHLPLMESGPWSVLAIISGYLYFVKVYGPAMMKSRQPLQLKEVMVAYNFLMVLLSFWMFYEGCMFLNFGLDTWGCGKNDYISDTVTTRRFLFVAWVFFFSKIIEFIDTIFMVLRKRFDQISNLHVIHHSVVPITCWLGIKFAPVGSNSWFPLMNSLVHTIMYAYFGLMAMSDSLSQETVNLLKVYKPWLTRLQIIQFCFALVHVLVSSVAAFTSCPLGHLPKTFFVLNLGNALLFLGLFCNFYRSNYSKDQTCNAPVVDVKQKSNAGVKHGKSL